MGARGPRSSLDLDALAVSDRFLLFNFTRLRERLDALADDKVLHRLEDASRAGSLARYRNRQSVYQFAELGYRAFSAVEDVLAARIRDANLS
jgi:hypothetical protein